MDACIPRTAEKGDTIWRTGSEASGLYLIVSGCIRAETSQTRHGPAMLTIFHAGSWIGEAEIIADTGRITRMTALRKCSLMFLPRSVIVSLAKEYPELWRGLGYLAAEHLYVAVAGLNDLMIRSSSGRLAAVLLRICGARVPEFARFVHTDLDVTQTELGQLCNLSRSVIAERLVDFEKRAIISTGYGRVKILDVAALAEEAG
ncbi:MAG: Crp/Fnr family transcriptional regulator, partial [Gammaproteobacteria bacterium]